MTGAGFWNRSTRAAAAMEVDAESKKRGRTAFEAAPEAAHAESIESQMDLLLPQGGDGGDGSDSAGSDAEGSDAEMDDGMGSPGRGARGPAPRGVDAAPPRKPEPGGGAVRSMDDLLREKREREAKKEQRRLEAEREEAKHDAELAAMKDMCDGALQMLSGMDESLPAAVRADGAFSATGPEAEGAGGGGSG